MRTVLEYYLPQWSGSVEHYSCNKPLPSVNMMRRPWHMEEVYWACTLCNAWLDIHHWIWREPASILKTSLNCESTCRILMAQIRAYRKLQQKWWWLMGLPIESAIFHMAGDAHEWFHEHDNQISSFLFWFLFLFFVSVSTKPIYSCDVWGPSSHMTWTKLSMWDEKEILRVEVPSAARMTRFWRPTQMLALLWFLWPNGIDYW